MSNKIYVFAARYPFEILSDYLPYERQKEIAACMSEQSANAKYYAFKLLETALKAVCGESLQSSNLVRTESGKWVCDVCELSLSHSNDVVAVALSDMPVGVDVELIDLERFDTRLQQRIFTDKEQSFAASMSDTQRAEYANRLWTVKEAEFKRQGGKSFVAKRVETDCKQYQTAILNDGKNRYFLSVATALDSAIDFHLQRLTVSKD